MRLLLPSRVLQAALPMLVPAVVAALILPAFGVMDWSAAGWVCAAAAPMAIALGLWRERDMMAVERFGEAARARLAGAGDIELPTLRSYTARQLSVVVMRMQRAARQRLSELERMGRLRERLLDSVPDPVLTIDSEGRITSANAAACELFGMSAVGKPLFAVVRQPALNAAVDTVLGGGAAQAVDLNWGIEPLMRELSVRIQPLLPRAPDGTAALLAMLDLTDARRAERLRSDFIANASHELKTPLATLVGFIETLRGPARDDVEARDRFLAIMQDQAARMTRLVEDLLSLSRIELNEHLPPTGRVDLVDVAERVAAALELHATRRQMEIDITSAPHLPQATGATEELVQLVQNLVDNAIKYGRTGGRIDIHITRPATVPPQFSRTALGAVALSVADDGDGIAREHLPRLTERFYRVDTARSRAAGGTGLGLAIVKHILTRHRGAMTIDSEPGKGARFTVYLPAAGDPAVQPPGAAILRRVSGDPPERP